MTYKTLDYLSNALNFYTKRQIADELEVNVSTITRWLKGESDPKEYVVDRLQKLINAKTTRRTKPGDFTFIDLFAGIGGIRKAFEDVNGECVFTSEWDSYAQMTYAHNYPDGELLNGDITKITDAQEIPDHDVLLAGFPCQPFSIAGVSKKNALGRSHGFEDETQGTLFFDVARIIDEKRPSAFVLENVKNLMSHDKGNTFRIIMRTLEEELEYQVFPKVIDGQHWVPQHRERIVLVGFKKETYFDWDMLNFPEKGAVKLGSILHRTDGTEPYLEHDGDKYFDSMNQKVLDKYTLTDHLWTYLQNYAAKHKAKGNGFGFGLVKETDIARTLSARYYKDGSEILIYQEGKNPRRLTPRECARLMGFKDDYVIPVSDTRAYKQFGNSVVVPVFHEVAKAIKPLVLEAKSYSEEPSLVS